MEEVEILKPRIHAVARTPCVAVVAVSRAEADRVLPTRDGGFLRARMRQALGLPVM